jgi:glycosyltransferase involved in cell wall biosynthesis
MLTVSVIVPTHNRPTLLRETIASVATQTYRPKEIVIVDDGSVPPVDCELLQREFDLSIKLARNDKPLKQAYARDQGVKIASGDLVIHLDDDDLLTPNALERLVGLLENNQSLELIFLGATGFGERAKDFNEAQEKAKHAVFHITRGREIEKELFELSPHLFVALLTSVPMTFQRSIEYRDVWHRVSSLRRSAYMLDPDIANEEEAMRRLCPPLRESEWAMYAAASCKTAITLEHLYLQRCDLQGYFSIESKKEVAISSAIDIKTHLSRAAKKMTEFQPWEKEISDSLAKAYFASAFFYFNNNRRLLAYRALANAFKIKPDKSYLRFAMRMLLPPDNGEL